MPKKLLHSLILVIVGIAIWYFPIPAGVKPQAWHLFAIFVATILGFILQPFPMGLVAFISVTFTALVGVLTPAEVLSGFSNSTIWLIVSAFLFSKAFIKTGLGRRIAYFIMRAIGHRTLNMAYALALSDLIIAPATPSVTARSAGIIFPIAKSLSVAFDSEPNNGPRKMGAFLVQSVTHVSMVTSSMFLTSQAGNPLLAALALKTLNFQVDWFMWFKVAIVPGIISLLAVPYFLYKVYPPEIKETPQAKVIAQAELEKMGPATGAEKILAGVFVLALILWATGQWTNIDATAVGMLGVAIMLATRVLEWQDVLGEKSAWDTMVWMGTIIAQAGFLSSLGLVGWFSNVVSGSLTGYSWQATFVVVILVYMYSHYAFAGLSSKVTALFPALVTVAVVAGTPPAVAVLSMGFVSSLCGCLTHYAAGPSPLFYGAGYTDLKTWWIIGFAVSVLHLIIWIGIGSIWWKILGMW